MKNLILILSLGFMIVPAFADNGVCIYNNLKKFGGGYARANRLLVEKNYGCRGEVFPSRTISLDKEKGTEYTASRVNVFGNIVRSGKQSSCFYVAYRVNRNNGERTEMVRTECSKGVAGFLDELSQRL